MTLTHKDYIIVLGLVITEANEEGGWDVPDAYATRAGQEWTMDLTTESEWKNDPYIHPERWTHLKASVWVKPDQLHGFETPRAAETKAIEFAQKAIDCGFDPKLAPLA